MTSLPASRRKPGRPKQPEALRDAILDHAEICFAERGFTGARTRDITMRAGVNQAMIRYYFGSKQDLFDTVFKRRGGQVTAQREALLDQLLAAPAPPTVEALIRAYLEPQWRMKHADPNGAAFIRLQARLHAEPEAHALDLRRSVYDPSTHRYIDALARVMPDVPKRIIGLRMAFLVGTYLFMLNDLGRIDDLAEGGMTDLPGADLLRELVAFLSAGFKAPTD